MSYRFATERVHVALRNIERWNPKTNALLAVLTDNALENARRFDDDAEQGRWPGALYGITLTIKDNIDIEGIPTTAGSRILSNNIPYSNSFVVERLMRNGAVIVGKANLHEWALGSTTHDVPLSISSN